MVIEELSADWREILGLGHDVFGIDNETTDFYICNKVQHHALIFPIYLLPERTFYLQADSRPSTKQFDHFDHFNLCKSDRSLPLQCPRVNMVGPSRTLANPPTDEPAPT